MYLWETNSEFVEDELWRALDDTTTDVDYSPVQHQFHRYQKGGGKKSLQQRCRDYREGIAQDVISEFLVEPGTMPPK